MLEERWICDLCKLEIIKDPPSGKRMFFMACEEIQLVPLTDGKASETVICVVCESGLRSFFKGNFK